MAANPTLSSWGLSTEVEPGEIVAICGSNGSGKSSVLRVMLGLYAPAMGNIRFDGVDSRQFDPRTLRRQIAYLPQVPEMLEGTVAENLRFAEPLAEEFRLRQALMMADAWEAVQNMPQGIHSRIGGEGALLSSGMAARLMLARLYLMEERPLVLCDELPAQILNSATGERFRQQMAGWRGKRTVFFITHREDWLELADRVVVLKPEQRPIVERRQPIAGGNHG